MRVGSPAGRGAETQAFRSRVLPDLESRGAQVSRPLSCSQRFAALPDQDQPEQVEGVEEGGRCRGESQSPPASPHCVAGGG